MISFLNPENPWSDTARAFVLGMAVCGVYYFIVHLPSMRGSFLHAYTTHDPTQYAIVMLFVWANAEHLFCYLRSGREQAAINHKWLPSRAGLEDADQAGVLINFINQHHASTKKTMIYNRLQSALNFVYERRSSDGFREYLESLEARDADQVYQRYGFSRFVIAILPIMGLIGTVVHFGTALSGLTLEGIAGKLPAILGGIGTAFNTTFAAMSGLAVTTLVYFLIERRDEGSLKRINAYVEDELLYRFKTVDGTITPFIDALKESQSNVLSSLGSFEKKVMEEWYSRLETAEQRWEQVDQRQEYNLVQILQIVEKQQQTHVTKIMQVNTDLVVAQKMMSELANTIVGDGKLLQLQDRLVENLTLLRQSQQLEGAMHELTAAIHLFTARQHSSTSLRAAA